MTLTPRASRAAAFAAVVLLALIGHGVAVRHEFVNWDDDLLVTKNELLNPVTTTGLARIWSGPVQGLYAPLSYTTWAAVTPIARTTPDAENISLRPAPYHALNVLLHAGCCAMVLAILLQLTGGRVTASAVGAGVFAVHPLQVEAVAWVSGMNNLLAGLFSLAAIACYLRAFRPTLSEGERTAVRGETPHNERRTKSQKPWSKSNATQGPTSRPSPLPSPLRVEGVWYLASCVMLLLAGFSKPTAIVVPLLIAVIDLAIVRRPWRRVAIGVLPLLVIAVPFAIAGRMAQESSNIVAPSPPARLVVAADAVGFYLHKLVWPTKLTFDYGRTPESVLATCGSPATWIALAVAVVAAGVTFRRWPWVAGALGVFVGGMCLVIGLVPFDFQTYSTVADRYAYLSMLGVAILLALVLARTPPAARVIATCFVLALTVLAIGQSLVWRSTQTLVEHQFTVQPTSLAGHSLAAGLANLRKDFAAAEQHYLACLAIRPRDITSNNNYGNFLLEQQRFSEAIPYYQTAYESGERKALLFNNWGLALFRTHRFPEAAEAFAAALERDPNLLNAHLNQGYVLGRLGQFDQAAVHFNRALQLDPNNRLAREGLAKLQAVRGRAPN